MCTSDFSIREKSVDVCDVLNQRKRAGCNSFFFFLPLVLVNIKLRSMQRVLCLLRTCQIFIHSSVMSQITHCSIVNCLDSYVQWEQKVIQVNIRVWYVVIQHATPAVAEEAFTESIIVYSKFWQTFLLKMHLSFVMFLLFNNYLQCSGLCNVCLCCFSPTR